MTKHDTVPKGEQKNLASRQTLLLSLSSRLAVACDEA